MSCSRLQSPSRSSPGSYRVWKLSRMGGQRNRSFRGSPNGHLYQRAGAFDLAIALPPEPFVELGANMRIELLLDHGCGQNVDLPASVTMLGEIGLRSAITGFDLDAFAQAGIVERVHLCAREPDADDTEARAEARERLLPGPLQVEAGRVVIGNKVDHDV